MALAAFCRRCGLPNPGPYRFCPRCGENLSLNSAAKPYDSAPAASGAGTQPSAAPTAAPPGPAVPPYMLPPVRRADAVSIFIEMFRSWAKDWIAYLGIFFACGVANVGILVAATWAILGEPHSTTHFMVPSASTGIFALPVTYLFAIVAALLLDTVARAIVGATVTYHAISKRRGARVTWSAAFREGIGRFPRVLVGLIIVDLLGITIVVLELLPYVGGTPTRPNPASLALEGGLILAVLPMLYLSIALALYAPAIMMEGISAVQSLRRSWSLTRGHRLSIFGAQLLAGFIALAVSLSATFGPNLFGNELLATAATIVTTAITGSWSILLAAVAYELIGEEQREQARQWAAMTSLLRASVPERAPAYAYPGAPPCAVCGSSLLWVPAYGRWYCGRCGAYR